MPDQLSELDFWALVGDLETEVLDFKRGAPRSELRELFVAFAMASGGLAVLGVTDAREIVGCPLSQTTHDNVTRAAADCDIEVDLREMTVGDARVTLVSIPEVAGRIITTPDGRLLRRVGSENLPLRNEQLVRFVRSRDTQSAEEAEASLSLDEIDLTALNRALDCAGRPRVRRGQGALRALVDLGVADNNGPGSHPTIRVAAALLFADEPAKTVSGAAVQAVRRAGLGPIAGVTLARAELRGPLVTVADDALAFIAQHTKSYEVVVGTRREAMPEYPVRALREAVLNALAHRDYAMAGTTTDVTIWDDRVEIRSPGPLPGPITLDNIRSDHFSRNRRIMRVLKTMGLVEEYGEGIDRMFEEMAKRLMEPPVIDPTPTSVTVTLFNRFRVGLEDQVWLATLGHLDLTVAERLALLIARDEGLVTSRRLRSSIEDVNASTVLAAAVAKGLLRRRGERGGSHYVLSEEVILRAGASGVEAQARKRHLLLNEARRRGSISTVEGAALLGEQLVVVRHLLNDLARTEHLVAEGNTRSRRYRAI